MLRYLDKIPSEDVTFYLTLSTDFDIAQTKNHQIYFILGAYCAIPLENRAFLKYIQLLLYSYWNIFEV